MKLLGSVAIVEYAEVGDDDPAMCERLQNLARPSTGHWWEFVRRLVPLLADAGDEHFSQVRDVLLGRARDDLPRAAGLDAALREALQGKHVSRSTVRLTELWDRLVEYRNREIGHGAAGQRGGEHYNRISRSLLLGVSEVLGKVDVLAGRKLIYVADVRRQKSGAWLVERYELIGESARRIESLDLPESGPDHLPKPERLYIETHVRASAEANTSCLRSLHPLLIYDVETSEVFFLNGRRGQRKADYLSYRSGNVKREGLQADQREFLGRVLGAAVDDSEIQHWAKRSRAEEPAAADDHNDEPRRTIGEFELLSRIGRGGMGVVYRARQPSLDRDVALKCLLRSGDPKSEARFAREIRALGRVDHPNLVKTFTSGSEGDQWFYAMELIEGTDLSRVCYALSASNASEVTDRDWINALSTACDESRATEEPLSEDSADGGVSRTASRADAEAVPREASPPAVTAVPSSASYMSRIVEIVRQVAQAAHRLHQAGVVHRDIKPANIMVTEEGAHAVLMDLGLAQLADEAEGRLTRTRQFVGTLRYASPEQVLAAGQLDRRSDVYSLGATLWELLTLQPMFAATESTSTPELMHRIQYEEPSRTRRHNPRVGKDLDAIVMKCLEKNPNRRYTTAAELADDLRRLQQGEPIRARPVGRIGRLGRWCRRHPMAAAAAILLLSLCLVAGFFATDYGQVKIDLSQNARVKEVRIDGESRDISALSRPIRLRTGRHHLLVALDSFEPCSISFDVRRGTTVTPTLNLVPLKPSEDDETVTVSADHDEGTRVRVIVEADQGWQTYEVNLKAGRTYIITATGAWTCSDGSKFPRTEEFGADGGGATSSFGFFKVNRSFAMGCLMAQVEGQEYEIGGYRLLKTERSGKLLFRMNDTAPDDNDGKLHVDVQELSDEAAAAIDESFVVRSDLNDDAADCGWQKSRIHLTAGESITLELYGKWAISSLVAHCGPEGHATPEDAGNALGFPWAAGIPVGALLARIGPDGPVFAVTPQGEASVVLTADTTGDLYFNINDQQRADNGGRIVVVPIGRQ